MARTATSASTGPARPLPSYRVTLALAAITCALAPAYGIRWHYGFYPTTLLEHAIAVTFLAFLIESAIARQLPGLRSAYLLPAVLFLIAGAISVPVAPSRTAALGLYRAYIVEPIAFSWVLLNAVRTPARTLAIAGGLFLGGAVVSLANSAVIGVALYSHAYDVINTPPVVIYSTANAIALFVVPLVALAGALALYGEGWARPLAAAYFVFGTLGAVMSFSRGGYLALAAVVLGLALTHRRRWLLLAGAVVLTIVLALVPSIRRRVLIEVTGSGGETFSSRLDIWSAAIKVIEQQPLFGAGLSGYQQRAAPFFSHAHTQQYVDFIDPHNIVLNFWVETGLLGLVSMAWLIGAGLVLNLRAWVSDAAAGWRPYHLGVALALVAVVVHGLVDVPYFKNDLSLEFWALLGIAAAAARWGATSPAAS